MIVSFENAKRLDFISVNIEFTKEMSVTLILNLLLYFCFCCYFIGDEGKYINKRKVFCISFLFELEILSTFNVIEFLIIIFGFFKT